TPDYRLSIQSSKLGPVSIQLNSGSSSLLNNLSTGSLASYEVDGLSTPITSDSRTITLAPGVSANLSAQSATGVATTISVSQQTLSVSNALSTFVNAYNAATDELNNSHGTSGGALQGQSLIVNLGNTLQQLGTFSSGASGIGSLTDLGITYNRTGHLNFDPSVFSSATAGQITALTNFLGGATTGGFLQTATNLLSAVEDPTTGIIHGASTAIQSGITTGQSMIARNQARVDQLQKNLQLQLAKSDALVASLEQSYTVLNGLIQAQSLNTQALRNGY
ncbi:MAG: flagellar hook-associated 2 domain protein, partial [Bryobacterales bacterium]|nr:flagellar hook-associated 2 domain protein [Bryobacterales bacterium]